MVSSQRCILYPHAMNCLNKFTKNTAFMLQSSISYEHHKLLKQKRAVFSPIVVWGKRSCHFPLSFYISENDAHWPNAKWNRMQSTVTDFRPWFLSADAAMCCKWYRTKRHHLCIFLRCEHRDVWLYDSMFFHIVAISYSDTPISSASYQSL